MGLDMYLYRVKVLEGIERNTVIKEEELRKKYPHAVVMDKKQCKLKTITNAGIPITLIQMVPDPFKIGKAYSLYDTFRVECTSSYEDICFDCFDIKENDIGNVAIPRNEMPKYLKESRWSGLAFIMEEVDYQRKGLNDEGWELLPENCEYCEEKERVEALVTRGGLSPTFLDNWEDGKTLFWAWW